MIIIDCKQRSPEWFSVKAGVPSAGSCDQIVTENGEPSKSRQGYMDKLADEAIRGHVDEGYKSRPMEAGTERETESRIVFELDYSVQVQQVGFIFDDSRTAGCSPDGIFDGGILENFNGKKCGLELKNPLGKTHVKYLRENKLPTGVGYIQQIQMCLLVTGFEGWMFRSYCPGHKSFDFLVPRDEKFISKLKAELEVFCLELAKLIKKLKGG